MGAVLNPRFDVEQRHLTCKMICLEGRCTQRKRYRMCMLLNVAAHNVSIRNIKVSKRERHITYRQKTYIRFVMLT